MRVKKIEKDMKKNAKANSVIDDPFEVENSDNKKKTKVLPVIIVLAISAIIVILGYINWNTNFGIKIFDEFHEWLVGLEAGEGFNLISYILGANAICIYNSNFISSCKYIISILIQDERK